MLVILCHFLSFFIESQSVDEIIERAEKYLPDYFFTKRGNFENKSVFVDLLKKDLRYELINIFDTIRKIDVLKIKSNIIEDRVLNEETEAENPTLFVRINSGGTTLTGDDLIYSIYKAIFPDTKNLIESIGVNFIAPTQVLSLISRIVASELDNNCYIKKMNVRDFQRRIKNIDFKERLKKLRETKEIEKLFMQAINILSCEDNLLFEGKIPPVIIKQFIRKNQELFLFFVYWLHINNTELTDKIKLKMVAKLLSFSWFEFGNIQRLWNEKITNSLFWEEPLNELIWWTGQDGIHFLIKPDLLREYYLQPQIQNMFLESNEYRWGLWEEGVGQKIAEYYNNIKSQDFDTQVANEYFWKFIGKIQYNKQIILFAQRDYINSVFDDYNQMDDIEDTNVPWDWDHIYPNSWVYNMKYCENIIREWNGTNGNFRAISLEQNRRENDNVSPKERLENLEIRGCSFVFENDWENWQKIDDRIWSKEKAVNHFQAITTRMINIYEKFWTDLKIKELILESE